MKSKKVDIDSNNKDVLLKNNQMPLSWIWNEKDYDLVDKLKEVEHSMVEFYYYGYPDQHAGSINLSLRKEMDRNHRILQYDEKLNQIQSLLEKHEQELTINKEEYNE